MGNDESQELLNNRQGEKPNGLYKRSFHSWKKEAVFHATRMVGQKRRKQSNKREK